VLPQLDSAQRSARGGAARATLRASSTASVDVSRRVRASVMTMADYGLLRDATADGALTAAGYPGQIPGYGPANDGPRPNARRAARSAAPPDDRGPYRPMLDQVTWLGTAGVVGQGTLAVDDALFLTAGLRGERNDGFTRASRFAALPSLGVAFVRQTPLGTAGARGTIKLRAAYGSGLRPARSAARVTTWRGTGALGADLLPESQRGVEAGVDLYVDGVGASTGVSTGAAAPALGLHVTRFDQRADNLLQQVAVTPRTRWRPPVTAADSLRRGPRPFDYAVENVGQVTNRGWEVAGDLRTGPLTVAATLALVDSRVRRLAPSYTGDLFAGARTLDVPRRTVGLNATWRRPGWSAALGAARASDWINYDGLALARAAAPGTSDPADFVGPKLRAYWRRYAGVTRLSASASRDVGRGLALVLTGDNLLDRQEGEPDNATVLPGRTVMAGVRARF
jgi:iron complex outermembrane receptor protein